MAVYVHATIYVQVNVRVYNLETHVDIAINNPKGEYFYTGVSCAYIVHFFDQVMTLFKHTAYAVRGNLLIPA